MVGSSFVSKLVVVAKVAFVDGPFQLEEYLLATMSMEHNLFAGLMILSYPIVAYESLQTQKKYLSGSTDLAKWYKIGGLLVALTECASIGRLKYLFKIKKSCINILNN